MMTDENQNGFLEHELDYEEDLYGTELTAPVQTELIDVPNEIAYNELNEPNFEKYFGENIIYTTQDMLDDEYSDIAKLKILQVAGDDIRGRKVVCFYCCRLPNSDKINLNRLMEYMVKTLSQFVSNDYSLIYFHYGLTRQNNPGIKFLIDAYRKIDRNFKKNLKSIYLVHPTFFLRAIVNTLLRFVRNFRRGKTSKVAKKIVKIYHLSELKEVLFIDQLGIPECIKQYDQECGKTSDSTGASGDKKSNNSLSNLGQLQALSHRPTAQFCVSLIHIKQHYPDNYVPPIMENCISFLRKPENISHEGIFRKSPDIVLFEAVQLDIQKGDSVDFDHLNLPILVASLLKTFLRCLQEPLLTFQMYDSIVDIHAKSTAEAIEISRRIVSECLPGYNYRILKYLIEFLIEVDQNSEINKMTAENLANVFAPNLIWSLTNETSLTIIHVFIKFTKLLIDHFNDIFVRDVDDAN